jgi:hypothetical protein
MQATQGGDDMANHVRLNDVVVQLPPPVTDGQKQWEQQLTAELRLRLPQDEAEAKQVLAIMKETIERRSAGELVWKRTLAAAYILSMFPEDCRMARRIIKKLSCGDAA